MQLVVFASSAGERGAGGSGMRWVGVGTDVRKLFKRAVGVGAPKRRTRNQFSIRTLASGGGVRAVSAANVLAAAHRKRPRYGAAMSQAWFCFE